MRYHAPQITLSVIGAVLGLGLISYVTPPSIDGAASFFGFSGIDSQSRIVVLILSVAIVIALAFGLWWKKRKKSKPSTGAPTPKLDELKAYIASEKSDGKSDTQIKETLVGVGWKEETVDRAFR